MARTTTTATAMATIMNLYSAHDPKHPSCCSAILILNFKIKRLYHEVKVNLKKRKMKQGKSYQKELRIKRLVHKINTFACKQIFQTEIIQETNKIIEKAN